MKFITIWIPQGHIEALENLVKNGYYPNRAEAIRMFIRDGVLAELPLTKGDRRK